MRSRTAASTSFAASGVTSFSLVWPWKLGLRMKTETTEQAPAATSAEVIC